MLDLPPVFFQFQAKKLIKMLDLPLVNFENISPQIFFLTQTVFRHAGIAILSRKLIKMLDLPRVNFENISPQNY